MACGCETKQYNSARAMLNGREIVIRYRACTYCGERYRVTHDWKTEEILQYCRIAPKTERVGCHHTTLCWDCQRAAGPKEDRCSWSLKLRPVDGWTAKKSRIIEGSYHVKKCPLFIPDEPRKVRPW